MKGGTMDGIINGNGLFFILLLVALLGWGLALGVGAMGKQQDSWHAEVWARTHPHRD